MNATLAILPNAVRLVALPMPALATATVAVFVRTGSAHEARLVNGISHVVEHMVFKGTTTRDARRINVEAEHLGADANAHTDKDHTAYYLRGLPDHVGEFVDLLADLTLRPTFPADELERERQVLLQELAEDADDAVATGYKLFDAACFGLHGAALPVVGTPRHVERLQRADLATYVQRQYTGANLVVGAAGAIDADAFLRRAETAFAPLAAGTPNLVPLAVYEGGVRTRAQAGSSQTHLLLGGALPARRGGDGAHTEAGALAAAVLGEGMSSPLLHELRERRALAYHAACAADMLDMCGQFVIEASTAPERADECLEALLHLLVQHADRLEPQELVRARRQLAVRRLRNADKPLRRLEDAALDLFVHGRVRSLDERLAALADARADAVRGVFERLLADGLSLAVTGEVRRGTGARARERLARPTRP
ncbi:MAG TPA: pitrilysin family protein [Burkholderiaceae bacterium]|nr:pitrilysin family protein [Burkholderiaceae bacterium]